MSEVLMEVKDVKKHFPVKDNGLIRKTVAHVKAVDGVDLVIRRGETFALLGESGCGKSMTALSLMRLLPAGGRIIAGEARLDDPSDWMRPGMEGVVRLDAGRHAAWWVLGRRSISWVRRTFWL